jgi:hypothetical protein|tara:strand:+ start:534 stop:737 length:204 start_codon:yes stop_codon:yes gene_type:complete
METKTSIRTSIRWEEELPLVYLDGYCWAVLQNCQTVCLGDEQLAKKAITNGARTPTQISESVRKEKV